MLRFFIFSPTVMLGAACVFNITLAGVQCFGLQSVPSATTISSCSEACCELSYCSTWEFCPLGSTCSGYVGPSCWIGSPNLSKCVPQAQWNGAARVLPPPPPPPSQNFGFPDLTTVPVAIVDLSSNGSRAWSLSIDEGPPRDVVVPGGGYNSDFQDPPLLDSSLTALSATYSRVITVPALKTTTTLEFGAVNYGAEVYINDVLVGFHSGPNMPFAVDISNVTQPGGSYNLSVISRPFSYFAGTVPSTFRYTESWLKPADGWSSRTPNGISKYVRLILLPSVRVDSIVIQPSVVNATLTVHLVLRNDDKAGVDVNLTATLSSWNGSPWVYPAVAPVIVSVPSRGLSTTIVLHLPWLAPPESFWWPNRPWNASYTTQLHWFNVTLLAYGSNSTSVILSQTAQRFGFVEHSEGPFYYLVNGVRLNQLSDATPEMGMSYYDAYETEAFAPSSAAAVTWAKYMRVGMTSNRIHQSTPTQAMMNAADEVGFLLKPESPIRGCPGYEPCVFGPIFLQSVTELIRVW